MALFQKSVLNKYLREIDDKRIAELYSTYSTYFLNLEIQQNIRDSKEEQFQEGFLRELFVNVLGYVINPNPNYNLTTELKNETGAKKADGAILVNGKAIGVIELKSTSTKDLESIRQQAFDYKANQSECVYVVTSNFEKLRFYIDNAVDYEEFDLFTLSQQQFKLLYLCLHVDSIMAGIPKTAKTASLVKEENVTKKLYADYSIFKEKLFNDIISKDENIIVATRELAPLQEEQINKGTSSLVADERNSELAPLQNEQTDKGTSSFVVNNEKEAKLILFKKTQKLMDRFLFIFFAEDRGLIPPNTISTILTEWEQLKSLNVYVPLYTRFKNHFDYINAGWKGDNYEIFAYNGGLFLPDEILDNITISDEVLNKHTTILTKYDFDSEVDVNILGHIFEHSLNEIETMNAELEGQQIDLKKSKRKKDGVFYTPKYITKYIVDNTIGKLCEEKKEELSIVEDDYLRGKKGRKKDTIKQLETKLTDYRDWLLQITVVDPACGSGAFLNQALEFLIREHRWIDEMTAKLFGGGLVFQDVENSILENNLYGVDINEESVEIVKLSLWLRTAQKGRKLTSLNNNIKCGNSLIDDPEVAGDKAFKWEEEFPKVFAKGGFDVVIGNPPYVNLYNMESKHRDYFDNSTDFPSTHLKYDLYILFFDRGFNILKTNGLFSFIIPSVILSIPYGRALRKKLCSDYTIETIVDFTGFKVFSEAMVESCILSIRRTKSVDNHEIIIKKPKNEIFDFNENSKLIYQNLFLTTEGHQFRIDLDNSSIAIIEKIKFNSVALESIYYVSKGIVAFSKIDNRKKEDFLFKENKNNHCYKYLEGRDVSRYLIEFDSKYIEYDKDIMSRPTFPELHLNPKIIIRAISGGINATFDPDGYFIDQKLIICSSRKLIENYISSGKRPKTKILNNSEEIDYWSTLGILNSKISAFYYLKMLKGGVSVLPEDIRQFPIFPHSIVRKSLCIKVKEILILKQKYNVIRFSMLNLLQSDYEIDKLSTKLQKWYELDFKQFVTELKKKKIELTLTEKAVWMSYFNEKKAEAQELKSKIDATDNEIDLMVYKLYDLTYDEVLIVDPETRISREVYGG